MRNRAVSFLTSLVFPWTCQMCEKILRPTEQSICHICMSTLPCAGDLEQREFGALASTINAKSKATLLNTSEVSVLCYALKYGNNFLMARALGYQKMANAFLEGCGKHENTRNVILVPMPVSWRRKLGRGYNQSEQLALGIRKRLKREGRSCQLLPLLEKASHRASQIHFGPHGRWQNAQGAVRARRKGAKKERIREDALLVLIDDTVTTGASLVLAGEQLKAAYPNNDLLLLALALEP